MRGACHQVSNMAIDVILFLRVDATGTLSHLSVVVTTGLTFENTTVLPVFPVNVLQFTLVYVIES